MVINGLVILLSLVQWVSVLDGVFRIPTDDSQPHSICSLSFSGYFFYPSKGKDNAMNKMKEGDVLMIEADLTSTPTSLSFFINQSAQRLIVLNLPKSIRFVVWNDFSSSSSYFHSDSSFDFWFIHSYTLSFFLSLSFTLFLFLSSFFLLFPSLPPLIQVSMYDEGDSVEVLSLEQASQKTQRDGVSEERIEM